MIEKRLIVGLIVERWAPVSQWGSITWRPSQVLTTVPDAAPWTPLGRNPQREQFFAGTAVIELFSTETTNYRDNLLSAAPKLWVVLRPSGDEPPVDVVAVTADPAEGEAFTEAGSDVVDTVDMPAEVAAEVAAFVTEHHVERVFEKRKRDKSRFDRHGAGGPKAVGGATKPGDGAKDQ